MKFASFFYTPPEAKSDKVDEQNDQAMDNVLSFINGLNLKSPVDVVDDNPIGGATNSLTFGDHSVRSLKRSGTSLTGVGGGASLRVPLDLRRRHIIEGLTIKTDEEYESFPLVSVGALSVVIFRNCVFERRRGDTTQKWVDVANGGKAIFVGCMFLSSTTVSGGTVISNAGAAANVQVVGCYNGTGVAFAGVTSAALGNL